jgi:hypothetical protein
MRRSGMRRRPKSSRVARRKTRVLVVEVADVDVDVDVVEADEATQLRRTLFLVRRLLMWTLGKMRISCRRL